MFQGLAVPSLLRVRAASPPPPPKKKKNGRYARAPPTCTYFAIACIYPQHQYLANLKFTREHSQTSRGHAESAGTLLASAGRLLACARNPWTRLPIFESVIPIRARLSTAIKRMKPRPRIKHNDDLTSCFKEFDTFDQSSLHLVGSFPLHDNSLRAFACACPAHTHAPCTRECLHLPSASVPRERSLHPCELRASYTVYGMLPYIS